MPKMQVDEALIRQLNALMEETGLSEIEIAEGNRSVRVCRTPAGQTIVAPQPMMPPAATAAVQPAAPGTEAAVAGAVTSPMVGTVYLAPQPGAAPFIQAGDRVAEGDTLMIIEAMKVMNPIPAPKAAVVKEVRVHDGQPVEFGDVLLVLE